MVALIQITIVDSPDVLVHLLNYRKKRNTGNHKSNTTATFSNTQQKKPFRFEQMNSFRACGPSVSSHSHDNRLTGDKKDGPMGGKKQTVLFC